MGKELGLCVILDSYIFLNIERMKEEQNEYGYD
jgi:hypothetical protein